MYKENPKTKGSGIICAIPQTGICPNKCEDCFFQSGRSYLEPLDKNLPNMPPQDITSKRVVRINDGNDSNINPGEVILDTEKYSMKFYNTSIPINLEKFNAPVVLTINPGKMTNTSFYKTYSKNLMFVRFRTNTWNLKTLRYAVNYYSMKEVPIVLTFMAYFDKKIPDNHKKNYVYRKRTLNSYNAITTKIWRQIMQYWEDTELEKWVYSCGKIEGKKGITACRYCGNCLREYFATIERMKENI